MQKEQIAALQSVLLDHLAEGVCLLTHDGRVLYMNPAAQEALLLAGPVDHERRLEQRGGPVGRRLHGIIDIRHQAAPSADSRDSRRQVERQRARAVDRSA